MYRSPCSKFDVYKNDVPKKSETTQKKIQRKLETKETRKVHLSFGHRVEPIVFLQPYGRSGSSNMIFEESMPADKYIYVTKAKSSSSLIVHMEQ